MTLLRKADLPENHPLGRLYNVAAAAKSKGGAK